MFSYIVGRRCVHVMYGDGHVESVSASFGHDEQELLLHNLLAQEARDDVPPPPSGWRETLKDFLPEENDRP